MLGGQHHEGHPIQGVWTGRKHFNFLTRRVGLTRFVGHGKSHRCAFGTSNPVALSFLHAVGPIEFIEARQETVSISSDAHHPLSHGFLQHRVTSALAEAIFDFVIGKYCAQGWAPVDFAVRQVGNSKAH